MEKNSWKHKIIYLLSIFIVSGIFGFIYETIFYRFDLGYFVKRGTTFGPWIPIYSFGAILIVFLCYKFKKKPALVFLLSGLVCGILEYLSGYLLLTIYNERLWNYHTEILNYGNINGFICLRSVLFFALSGLLLIYVIMPLISKLMKKINNHLYISFTLFFSIIYLIDVILFRIFK